MSSIFRSLVVLSALTIQACSVSPSDQQVAAMPHLLLTEPLQVNYKSEIALARLSEVILRADITDPQRAQLYYDRGVIYDSVGLRSLARLDFNRALRLKPDLVEAYNFIGIHYTQMQEYNQAYDAFDSAIELEPKHEYAYLNRGIALYYGGRPELATDDLAYFASRKPNDAYRVLWLYFAEHSTDKEKALINLKRRQAKIGRNDWGRAIIDMYLGELSQSDFIAILDIDDEAIESEKRIQRLCEAYFYLGKLNQQNNQLTAAENYFKLAQSTSVYEYVEHRYAVLELEQMNQMVVAK